MIESIAPDWRLLTLKRFVQVEKMLTEYKIEKQELSKLIHKIKAKKKEIENLIIFEEGRCEQ